MLNADYVAGLLDGEGSFIIGNPARDRLYASITVANTDTLVIQLLYHTFKDWGLLCTRPYLGRTKENHKDMLRLAVTSTESINILCSILKDKLVIKQRQAEILIEFTTLRLIEGREKVFDEREHALHKEIQRLNKKGKT